jgi:hypothetical protein
MEHGNRPFDSGFLLSRHQIEALERVARTNDSSPAFLISLAVDALISEAALNHDWLLLPRCTGKAAQ